MTDSQNYVSQAAEFIKARQQEQKETNEEHRAFRLGMAALAVAGLARGHFVRRGR